LAFCAVENMYMAVSMSLMIDS